MTEDDRRTDGPVLFKYTSSHGRGLVARISEEAQRGDDKLRELIARARQLPTISDYGQSYEKGPHHDKEHDRGGGYSKEFSRT